MGFVRKSRPNRSKQDHLTEHFVPGTKARTAAAPCGVNRKAAAGLQQTLDALKESVEDFVTRVR